MRRDESSAELVFFVDRCLGANAVPDALRAVGARIEIHANHFEDDAPDEAILAFVGQNDWIFLSKDKRIRHRAAELHALMGAGVGAFISTSGNATGENLGRGFVAALPRMTQICRTHTRPLIATITLAGAVAVLHGHRRGGVRR